jgi:hypothetical protein
LGFIFKNAIIKKRAVNSNSRINGSLFILENYEALMCAVLFIQGVVIYVG